ncbi:hypothetical protein ABH961_003025 [Bacillus sp. RC251]
MTNTHPEENQFQNQILNQIMPSDDNKFMEIDDVVDNLGLLPLAILTSTWSCLEEVQLLFPL